MMIRSVGRGAVSIGRWVADPAAGSLIGTGRLGEIRVRVTYCVDNCMLFILVER